MIGLGCDITLGMHIQRIGSDVGDQFRGARCGIDAQQALLIARSNFVNSFLGVIRRREDAERVRADFPEASFEERGPCVGDIEEWGIGAFDGTSQKAWWRVLFMTPFDAWE